MVLGVCGNGSRPVGPAVGGEVREKPEENGGGDRAAAGQNRVLERPPERSRQGCRSGDLSPHESRPRRSGAGRGLHARPNQRIDGGDRQHRRPFPAAHGA